MNKQLLKIEFETEMQLEEFKSWLLNSGEQDFYDYFEMACDVTGTFHTTEEWDELRYRSYK